PTKLASGVSCFAWARPMIGAKPPNAIRTRTAARIVSEAVSEVDHGRPILTARPIETSNTELRVLAPWETQSGTRRAMSRCAWQPNAPVQLQRIQIRVPAKPAQFNSDPLTASAFVRLPEH